MYSHMEPCSGTHCLKLTLKQTSMNAWMIVFEDVSRGIWVYVEQFRDNWT